MDENDEQKKFNNVDLTDSINSKHFFKYTIKDFIFKEDVFYLFILFVSNV